MWCDTCQAGSEGCRCGDVMGEDVEGVCTSNGQMRVHKPGCNGYGVGCDLAAASKTARCPECRAEEGVQHGPGCTQRPDYCGKCGGVGLHMSECPVLQKENAVRLAEELAELRAAAAEAAEGTTSDLARWWTAQAAAEAPEIARKAAEYGSNSLEELGRHVARLQGRSVTSAEALELGCWINAVQKIERWTDAVLRGETGKTDSLHDLSVYARMALRVKETGGWPGEGAGPEVG